MAVTLKDFVEQALIDITTAVNQAKEKSPLCIAPGVVEGEMQLEPQLVDFTIQVEVSEDKNKAIDGKVSVPIISVLKASAGAKTDHKNREMTTQNINFSVPVYFQSKNAK
ncbi:MAG: hypothetical protein MI799_09130 [Desulfobacterales bacterium]|nr:hypothetical protein [Desulfobacterales bacterium]